MTEFRKTAHLGPENEPLDTEKKIQLLVDRKQTERMGCLGLVCQISIFGHPSAPGAELPKDDGGGRSLREEFVERRLRVLEGGEP